ncbi:DNA/RNA non-specific endonuclease [Paenibacillus sp. OK060]|uniref:DNA/RNA non-specific endonuclease n=1 Tax=Paenibacillus sp. OK060 TaxID=1881034 RepID=UPI00087E6953|nr:DNA/RNA non-specific endonuclease [Paenibacillus sp. OK060]SDL47090.1 DNA/RNA non-specific endonuclease [Paenibacillus sp. OK060]
MRVENNQWLLGGGGSFILDGEANLRAGLLQQEGSNKAPVHVADLPPEPEPPLMPIEEYEAAQAAAAAEAAGVTQASTTNPKDGSLAGAALAITAMIPIMGALGGIAAQTAVGAGIAAVATGLIASVPKIGSFKPSGLNLLERLMNGFAEMQQQENEAKWAMLGKMLTAAKVLTTATSPLDLIKKLHQQHQEISATYYEIPGYIREKWTKQQADQDLKSSLDYFNKVMKNPEEYNILFVGPHFANITFDIGRPHITVEELGSYDYWKAQGLSLDEMQYLSWRLKAPMSEQAFAELWGEYDQYYATLQGQDNQVNLKNKRGSAGGLVGPVRSIPQASGITPPKVSTSPSSPIVPKVKSFVKKYWEESQKMRIVSGGGSHWSNNKTNKTGETASGNGKTANSGGGSTSKPVENPPKSKTSSGSSSSSKKNEGNSTTTSKPSTTPKTKPKTKPEKNETPNEVNTWKPSPSKNKDDVKPQADTKPPKSSEPEKPEENTNKPKDKLEGTEGTGNVGSQVDDVIRDGSHMKDGKLKPNATYKTGEYEYLYKTDSEGRLEKFTADDLKLTERDSRLPHDANTPGKEPGDHAGHLAGDRFGGSPEIDNLVSQLSNVNLSKYKVLENEWAKAIKAGKKVKVEVNIKYDGDALRPSIFEVKYSIDGKIKTTNIKN